MFNQAAIILEDKALGMADKDLKKSWRLNEQRNAQRNKLQRGRVETVSVRKRTFTGDGLEKLLSIP